MKEISLKEYVKLWRIADRNVPKFVELAEKAHQEDA